MASGPWTDEENDLLLADYFAMLADDIAGRRYSKSEHRRSLLPMLNDRSEGSVEFKQLQAWRGGRRDLKWQTVIAERHSQGITGHK